MYLAEERRSCLFMQNDELNKFSMNRWRTVCNPDPPKIPVDDWNITVEGKWETEVTDAKHVVYEFYLDGGMTQQTNFTIDAAQKQGSWVH